MLISEEQANVRLDSDENLINSLVRGKRGRKEGDTNLPPMIREIIAVEARLSGNGARTAREFGISTNHADLLRKGVITPYKGVDEKLSRAVDNRLEGVRSKALDILDQSLGALSSQIKQGEVKASTLAKIASDMSRVVERTQPTQEAGNKAFHLHLYKPEEQKSEEEFDVVEA